LRQHKLYKQTVRYLPQESDIEKEERVYSLAHHCGGNRPKRKHLALLQHFHTAHNVSIEQRATQKSHETRQAYPHRAAKYQLKGFLVRKLGCRRQHYGKLENQYSKGIHRKAEPYHQPCTAVTPHFGYQVVDDIRDRENKQSARKRNYPDSRQLLLYDIGYNKACGEYNATDKIEIGYFFRHILVFLVVIKHTSPVLVERY